MMESDLPFKQRHDYMPGMMIVQLEKGAIRETLAEERPAFTAETARRLPAPILGPLDYLRVNKGLATVEPTFSTRRTDLEHAPVYLKTRQRLAVLTSVTDVDSDENQGINIFSLAERVTEKDVRDLADSPGIHMAELMPARWTQVATGGDPQRNLQWGLRAIRWFDAAKPSASRVRVAILDTGIDRGHPDLEEVVDFYDYGEFSSTDIIGHGTHVAGTIAAVSDNNVGISGVANCDLAVWKVFSDAQVDGGFYVDFDHYLRALHAVETNDKVRVVNLSLGGTRSSETERRLFDRLQEKGKVVVAAMGNGFEDGNPDVYPAKYRGVLAVGAVDEIGRRALFSCTGRHIDLVAPGCNILSTHPTQTSGHFRTTHYDTKDGTSMATPHVAGAAALLMAKNKHWTAIEVKRRLASTAAPVDGMGGKSRTYSYGRGLLNLRAALA